MKSYSSSGQDLKVLEILRPLWGFSAGGYFVDVGAGDGVTASNTALFELELGFKTGICIEPHTFSFARLCQNRQSWCCEHICVMDYTGYVEFVERGVHKYLSGAVGDFSDLRILSQVSSGHPILYKPCMSLADVLQRHRAPMYIDYLSMDTEGSEYIILSGFPFDKYKFQVISVEINHSQEGVVQKYRDKKEAIISLLDQNGYDLIDNCGADGIFLRRS